MSLFKFGNFEMEIDFTDVDVAEKPGGCGGNTE